MATSKEVLDAIDSLSQMASPERWRQMRVPMERLLRSQDEEITTLRAELAACKEALKQISDNAHAVAGGAMRFGSAGGSVVAGWAKDVADAALLKSGGGT